jgi:hypothetical protein
MLGRTYGKFDNQDLLLDVMVWFRLVAGVIDNPSEIPDVDGVPGGENVLSIEDLSYTSYG